MKYFTPDLFVRLQNFDPSSMNAADAEWEAAEERYEQRLRDLGPAVAPVLKQFEGLLLHDAAVLGISRRGDQFVIVLQKDVPPRDVVTLTYTLAAEPFIDRDAFPDPHRSGRMQFLYDEFDLAAEGEGSALAHSILFSNGWEIRLAFRDVQVASAQPIYPIPSRGPSPDCAPTATHLAGA